MNIGYACLAIGVTGTDQKSCIGRNASDEKLKQLIDHNLTSLEHIIDYNILNGINLFRISSDLIPFGSSPLNGLEWDVLFAARFRRIGEKIRESGIRVSMHPGQYTVLNSRDSDVACRAAADLAYHARVLDALGLDRRHKIVLHIGGTYHDKKSAISRFEAGYRMLDEAVKTRLVIENDDKSFNIGDLLKISEGLNVPVVYDNLHNLVNPCDTSKGDAYWIEACRNTWQREDGAQKIHYAQQHPIKRPGSHSAFIAIREFMRFLEQINRNDLDIMLEVKDKNLSAVKCILCTTKDRKIRSLENEWGKYKYKVLESGPAEYLAIRSLLKDKSGYPAVLFYEMIERALLQETTVGNAINAAQHVWGYFKDFATDKERRSFAEQIEICRSGRAPISKLKRMLWKMTVKYEQPYLLDSYYFIL